MTYHFSLVTYSEFIHQNNMRDYLIHFWVRYKPSAAAFAPTANKNNRIATKVYLFVSNFINQVLSGSDGIVIQVNAQFKRICKIFSNRLNGKLQRKRSSSNKKASTGNAIDAKVKLINLAAGTKTKIVKNFMPPA